MQALVQSCLHLIMRVKIQANIPTEVSVDMLVFMCAHLHIPPARFPAILPIYLMSIMHVLLNINIHLNMSINKHANMHLIL